MKKLFFRKRGNILAKKHNATGKAVRESRKHTHVKITLALVQNGISHGKNTGNNVFRDPRVSLESKKKESRTS